MIEISLLFTTEEHGKSLINDRKLPNKVINSKKQGEFATDTHRRTRTEGGGN